ncbi:MAG: response regulator [Chloroflexi bacterium]|nr:response regulator [Chloroflexota bacterium]
MLYIACIETDAQSRFTFEQIAVLLKARGIDNRLSFYPSPQEALNSIPQERPDVVFIDARAHPSLKPCGLELARTLRQHPLCKGMILVAMAEYAMPADRSAALAAGCHDFVPKPVRYQAIEDVITRQLHPPMV